MKFSKVTLLICFLPIIITSCKGDKIRKNIQSGVPDIELKVKRFEKDFCSGDLTGSEEDLKKLNNKYPIFYPFFIENIIKSPEGMPITQDASLYDEYAADVSLFCNDDFISALTDSVKLQFPNEDLFLPDLKRGLYNYQKNFPNRPLPAIVTFISGLQNGIFTYDTLLCIGLDMYLGEKALFYEYAGFPLFMRHRLEASSIAPNSMNVLATNIMQNVTGGNLLDHMLYLGKALYFTEKMLPNIPHENVIGYTTDQLEWCETNEMSIWSYFVENELLYNSIYSDYVTYISDTPTTSGMPKESPGKIAEWLGWQVVGAYMKNNPNVTMEDLLLETDAKKMLTLSKYKPKK